MQALITGGAGFIGSHLAERLLAQGDRIVTLDNLSTGRFENLAGPQQQPNFTFVQGSITDRDLVERLVTECDLVIHLAAAVGVRLVVENPVQTLETNVFGTEIVLKAVRHQQKKLLLASTSEVYGKGVRIPFAEADDRLMGPTTISRWSYAASKALDEHLALAYHQQFGLPVIIFRLFNTVGPRQRGRYGMVIPRLVDQALAGKPLTVYGDGTQSRCFCDVADVVRAISDLASCDEAVGQVFNIGTDEEITIAALARRIIELTGSSSTIEYIPYTQAYGPGFEDMQRRVPDISKIKELIDWRPTYQLDQILARIIADRRQLTPPS